jgi:uncharacterized protein (TIRG00374 family)
MLKRLLLGLLISGFCVYLVFLKFQEENGIDKMLQALQTADYRWLAPAVLFMFLSLWLRALRWRYFMEPIKKVSTAKLFSAMMIGYMGNNVFPLRLGEFLRAYAIGKSAQVSKAASFATIIVERIIDLLSLLAILALTIFYHRFPDWIEKTGWLIFAVSAGFVIFIIFLMEKTERTLNLVEFVLTPLPRRLSERARKILRSFLEGFAVFKRAEHYWTIAWQSVVMWLFYAGIVYVTLLAFGLNTTYHLPWITSLVVLVMVSIGIMIPSSPGYVGTYHLLCIQAMAFFKVPASEAAGFAVVLHVVNFIPVTLVGVLYFWRENFSIKDATGEREIHSPQEIEPAGLPAEHDFTKKRDGE